MSVWDDVVGQEAAIAILKQAVKAAGEMVAAGVGLGVDAAPDSGEAAAISGGMTHAWLITGPPGSGRSTAARAFAAALQCPQGGCGVCHACQTALSGAHGDVRLVATEHVILRVLDVKPLIELAQRSPAEGRWRVIVIEDADRLNDSSGNMLLKAIEEPPPRTVWLLCAPSSDDVLTTIRSRCRRVGLRTPPVAAVAELLVRRDGADPAIAAFAARSAQSHIGLARRLALDEDARIRRRDVLKLPLKLRSVGAAVLAAGELIEVCNEESKASTTERDATEKAALLRSLGAEGLSTLPPAVRSQVKQLEENQKRRATRATRDVLDRSLIDLLSLYRDVLVLQLGEGRAGEVELVNAEMADLIEAEARNTTATSTLRRMEAIGQARERIEANVSPLLALESLMVQLRPAA
ncbi:DNA polymerase III subunit delta' [Kineosporia rhizophila]|uniref:DNA polymerase III subunit delta' n=1 Tax=Kineosporia TaxID=49184 RepID=UPI001E2F0AD7|nr:DNA polymerase III subunit delta' [Kineosporia sp. NBRC 101677]MCE0535996.1 DNA polymerase III subunit delta' [Kineosporia rhizophila]GLY14170.1 DNA polymerase III subunit delta [Kineosporia sp. NBRC 101677]